MQYDVVIIGAGPAGYVSAIRAGQTGLKTAIIDKSAVGGMCLNWGCIPTKALIESGKAYQSVLGAAAFGVSGIDKKAVSFDFAKAAKRAGRVVGKLTRGVEFLLNKNGVEVINGEAVIRSATEVSVAGRLLETRHIIIATGSTPTLPEGTAKGMNWTELLDLLTLEAIPEHVVLAGSGPHTVELAQFFAHIDRTVTIVSPDPELVRELDPALVSFLEKKLKKDKIRVLLSASITGQTETAVTIAGEDIPCGLLLNSHRRTGVIPESGTNLQTVNGFIQVNDNFETSAPGVYAIGDVNGRSVLAHSASAQGLHVVDRIQGIEREFPFDRIPMNLYTTPEIAQIGLTEPRLAESGIPFKVSEFPMSANGKALAEGQTEGFVRVLSETQYGEVLGVQVVADHATDMIAEAGALMEIEGTVFDLARSVHAHPTVSEIFMEAGFEAVDQAIHK